MFFHLVPTLILYNFRHLYKNTWFRISVWLDYNKYTSILSLCSQFEVTIFTQVRISMKYYIRCFKSLTSQRHLRMKITTQMLACSYEFARQFVTFPLFNRMFPEIKKIHISTVLRNCSNCFTLVRQYIRHWFYHINFLKVQIKT